MVSSFPLWQASKSVKDDIRRPRLPPPGRRRVRATRGHARGLRSRLLQGDSAGRLVHGRVLGVWRAVLLAGVLADEQGGDPDHGRGRPDDHGGAALRTPEPADHAVCRSCTHSPIPHRALCHFGACLPLTPAALDVSL